MTRREGGGAGDKRTDNGAATVIPRYYYSYPFVWSPDYEILSHNAYNVYTMIHNVPRHATPRRTASLR